MQTRLYISYSSSDGYRLSSVGGGASLRLECKLNYKDVSRTSDEYWIHCKIDMMSCQQLRCTWYLLYQDWGPWVFCVMKRTGKLLAVTCTSVT